MEAHYWSVSNGNKKHYQRGENKWIWGERGWRIDEAVTIGIERENESAAAGGLSPSPRTDVFRRLIFPLRV